MSSLIFNVQSTLKSKIDALEAERLNEIIKKLAAVDSYHSQEAFMQAPRDKSLLSSIETLIEDKKYGTVDAMLVVGIGGSNLAIKAIHELLQHTVSSTCKKDIFFAETVDPEYTQSLYEKIDSLLSDDKKIVLIIVTKSGLTTETIALGSIFIQLLKKHYHHEYHNHIVVITDEISPLADFAKKQSIPLLVIPAQIGGRYSALTAVGLFPAALLGYNIRELCEGACIAQSYGLTLDITKNPITQSALLTYRYYQTGTRVSNMFLFSADAQALGHWYRQLTAESLGKIKKTPTGTERVGILPIVSIGSTDLHSMVQLYFANPLPIITTFVTFGSDSSLSVPELSGIRLDAIVGKKLYSILNAIEKGTMQAYQDAQLPFMRLHVREKSERAIGEFMQWKMIETVLLARLLEINPFDQPEVERYKQQTRKILAHE